MDPEIAFDLLHTMLSGALQSAFGDGSGERAAAIEAALAGVVVRAFAKEG
jgi:outer membrane lipoprotein SlyB